MGWVIEGADLKSGAGNANSEQGRFLVDGFDNGFLPGRLQNPGGVYAEPAMGARPLRFRQRDRLAPRGPYYISGSLSMPRGVAVLPPLGIPRSLA